VRIDKINSRSIPPVNRFEVENLSDLVVIAGPNGVGKSRLVTAILSYFQSFNRADTSFEIAATCNAESSAWSKDRLVTSDPEDAQKLRQLLEQNQRRRNLKSTIIYYESDRSIQNVQPLKFQFDFADPWEEQIGKRFSFNPLKSRWQDTIHAIFKKIQNQKNAIASRAIQLKGEGHKSMNLEFTDPLDPFRDAFSKLLGPKMLVRADIQQQKLIYAEGGREDDIKSLSSGEREVLNIIFDFILRRPSDCVVFFDEPELHLHPELLHKLITTLRSVGTNNQFFLVSHSPAVIAASLEDSVVFLTPPKSDGSNQAVIVKPEDSTSDALHKLGQSIGVVALGHKIVLIEGNDASLDKQTYGHILENRHTNLVLQPVGGKDQLVSFDAVLDDILNRTIWGVQFYMLADRDAAPASVSPQDLTSKSGGRFRVLDRYHLENYFLDERVLAACFEDQEAEGSWLRSETDINAKLVEIARTHLSYATALIVAKHVRLKAGNVSLMPRNCSDKTADELSALILTTETAERSRVLSALDEAATKSLVQDTYRELEDSLGDGSWKHKIPGKPILASFASAANIPIGRLKSLYIAKNAARKLGAFNEIEKIFQQWS
jgi:predicted ATP-dependent endonuclease of OLD family